MPWINEIEQDSHDLRLLPGHSHSRVHPRLDGSDERASSWRWCPRIWYEMGWNSPINQRNTSTSYPDKYLQNEDTGFLTAEKPCWLCTIRTSNRKRFFNAARDWRIWRRSSWIKTYGIENLRPETNELWAPLKQQGKGDAESGERKQGDCYQRQTKGNCSKSDICSFKHDVSKRWKR